VVIAKSDAPQSIALIVLGQDAPYTVEASTTSQGGAEPATLDEMGTGDREFVYGRINDAAITKLELDLLDGEDLSVAVGSPGYAVAYPAQRGPVQAWGFFDAAGHVIHEQRSG